MVKQSVVECLDKMESIIESASKVPLSGKRVVDGVELLELIDKVRIALPEEIRQAETLIAERNRIAYETPYPESAAPRQASAFSEALADAREEAGRIVEEARREAAEVRSGADEYAESTLSSLEDTLEKTAAVVRKGIEELGRRNQGPVQGRPS